VFRRLSARAGVFPIAVDIFEGVFFAQLSYDILAHSKH
jgi:hypothetical protein